uniref:J domain-containing protein n=1 Tax=Globodera rostochiensis TaxID=31243 RepID=A0A914H0U6_GLORO
MFDRFKKLFVAGNNESISYYDLDAGISYGQKPGRRRHVQGVFSKAKETLTNPRSRANYDEQQRYSSGGGQYSPWTEATDMDYEMSKPPEFPTFTAMLKKAIALKSKFRCNVCGTKGITLDNVCYAAMPRQIAIVIRTVAV